MRTSCRNSIMAQFNSIRELPQNAHIKDCILILDGRTSELLSQVISLDHLIEFGIKDLSRVDKKKRPQPHAISIYFITNDSLKHLYQDFQEQAIYFSINILLTDEADENVMKDLSKKEHIMERLASFGELYIPCAYFSEGCAVMLSEAYKKKGATTFLSQISNKGSIEAVSYYGKLLFNSLMASVGPISSFQIFYYDSPFTRKSVEFLKALFEEYLESTEEAVKEGEKSVKLILVDREIDMLSPLVHSNCYFPYLVDEKKGEFNLQKAKLEIPYKEEKIEQTLDHKIFSVYKNMAFARAFEQIHGDFQTFTKTNKVAQFQKNRQEFEETRKMAEIIKEIPEYDDTMLGYKNNILFTEELLEIKKRLRLDELINLEHLVVTGYDFDGEMKKDKKIMKQVLEYLNTNAKTIEPEYEARLLIIIICCLDMTNDERTNLIKKLNQNKVGNGIAMNISKVMSKGITKYQALKKQSHINYLVDRHQPMVVSILEDFLEGKNITKFKSTQIGKPPSSPTKISKHKKRTITLAMCGGLGVNEICGLEQVAAKNKWEVNMLTDGIVTGRTYLNELSLI